MRLSILLIVLLLALPQRTTVAAQPSGEAPQWPPVSSEQRPGAYWWWMGSAVDEANITRQLEQYRDAGMGGVHIIPIYGAKGYEDRYVEYLSPRWMELMHYAVAEAHRLGLWMDMTTGTGWCFGGPNIPPALGCAEVVHQAWDAPAGQPLKLNIKTRLAQAIIAVAPGGNVVDLRDRLADDGSLDWQAPDSGWRVHAVSQKTTARLVKRSAPGGAGPMLNPFCGEALRQYVSRFSEAFTKYPGPLPRAQYHDSFEYDGNWTPDLFDEFEKRRGYRLQEHLAPLFGEGDPEDIARVKCDYRETISDMLLENVIRPWAAWAHEMGCVTRNQAHGSPGNLLDLYDAADIPETEMFNKDRDPLVAKFASSAAHITGKTKVAAETGTWLREHFTVTLADMKDLLDELFVSGVNHVIYHGTCYSPEDAPWPGWVFYASTQMNPRNAFWRDVPALNAYIARCQSVLQAGAPDNDLLLYWPIHDLWHDADGFTKQLTVHHTEWLVNQPLGSTADLLWKRGYLFDYVSDRLLDAAKVEKNLIRMTGGAYQALLVPPCTHIPVNTLRKLLELADQGATVAFQDHLPDDVPGKAGLESRRAALEQLLAGLAWDAQGRQARVGNGRVLVGDNLDALLTGAGIKRETLADSGFDLIRRKHGDARYYFLRYRGAESFEGWLPLAANPKSVVIMDPMTGRTGVAAARPATSGASEVYVQCAPGSSIILRTLDEQRIAAPHWEYTKAAGETLPLNGTWQIEFIAGGPDLPPPARMDSPQSWTTLGSEQVERFAGTARYTLVFDAPAGAADGWRLDLGRVAESACARLNGHDLGTVIAAPFRFDLPKGSLQSNGNTLEIEVTNLSANRIRDLDRRGVEWRVFHDINFVNNEYKPFDAAQWPLRDSGLLGPVTLQPRTAFIP